MSNSCFLLSSTAPDRIQVTINKGEVVEKIEEQIAALKQGRQVLFTLALLFVLGSISLPIIFL